MSLPLASLSKSVVQKNIAQNSAIETVKDIIQSFITQKYSSKQRSQQRVKTDSCSFDKAKWLLMLLSQKSFKETLHFNSKCDIKGSYSPIREKPFAVQLDVRGINEFSKLHFNFLIQLIYDPSPMIKLTVQKGKAFGKNLNLGFIANYSVLIEPFSSDIIKKDLGGNFIIKTVNGKKVNKSYPIKAN